MKVNKSQHLCCRISGLQADTYGSSAGWRALSSSFSLGWVPQLLGSNVTGTPASVTSSNVTSNIWIPCICQIIYFDVTIPSFFYSFLNVLSVISIARELLFFTDLFRFLPFVNWLRSFSTQLWQWLKFKTVLRSNLIKVTCLLWR